ncbi:MAG: 16S rRNA (cytidine(1402)-2'-O)-methyltransferase [Pseudomonadota bacterium]
MSQDFPPALYVVATPIGNLADLTVRAAAILARADQIYCEDTRTTRRLLDAYGISGTLARYDDHSDDAVRAQIVTAVSEGARIALVSDAGTPLISDPGFKLVRDVLAAGERVVPIPGPSAAIAAASVSGIATDAILFAGFLSSKAGQRRSRFEALKSVPASIVFYEAPQRLGSFLSDAADVFGAERHAVVLRELTKLHETVAQGTLAALAETFTASSPKGEIVVIIGADDRSAGEVTDDIIRAALVAPLAEQGVARASKQVAKTLGVSRSRVYDLALAVSRADDAPAPGTSTDE